MHLLIKQSCRSYAQSTQISHSYSMWRTNSIRVIRRQFQAIVKESVYIEKYVIKDQILSDDLRQTLALT
ncbi:unnamed protein product [Paramecium primaurelia]|uniref:Uncharacterized protein n=1 Tax=Paramecium primaurelia TaxID=5886 RepID=A0A8S1L8U0_PARPR|nr:unnamed protein product [Paramecium primaurelia]